MKRTIIFIMTLLLIFVPVVEGLSHGIGGEITRGLKFVLNTETPISFSEASIDLNFGIEISYPFDVIGTLSSFEVDEDGVRWKGLEAMFRFDLGYWEILNYNIIGLYFSYTEPHIHGSTTSVPRKVFKVGIGYFTDIEFIKHFFNVEINSRFNFYPRFGLNTDITPMLILFELEGGTHSHLGFITTFNIHTHFDGMVYNEISPGVVFEIDPIEFEISYGIFEQNLSGKIGVNIQF